MTKRRVVEEYFPVGKISELSSKEKTIRHGHISTMHVWWARRPLAASRSTQYASLINMPKDKQKLEETLDFIAKISEWKNSLDSNLFSSTMDDILKSNGGIAPKVLDPFGGGVLSLLKRYVWDVILLRQITIPFLY